MVDGYTFATGGDDDMLVLDFVRDRAQGLGRPARSMVLRNDGAGTVSFMTSEDGQHKSAVGSIPAGGFEQYSTSDGIRIHTLYVWASAAGTTIYVRATPGEGN